MEKFDFTFLDRMEERMKSGKSWRCSYGSYTFSCFEDNFHMYLDQKKILFLRRNPWDYCHYWLAADHKPRTTKWGQPLLDVLNRCDRIQSL